LAIYLERRIEKDSYCEKQLLPIIVARNITNYALALL